MSASSTPSHPGVYISPSPVYAASLSPAPFSPATPVSLTGTPQPVPSSSASKPSSSKPKPANVFSNDGSFLERFQRIKQEEEEKKKQEEALAKKRTFDQRFKNRGKRPSPTDANSNASEEPAAKKSKAEKPMTEYERELKSYTNSLKDNGIGVRPLVK